MAFSFNWAGVNVQPIQPKDTMEQARVDAANLGAAVRGYEVRKANKEYGDLIKNYREGNYSDRVIALKEELTRLKERNRVIAAQLGM